MALKSNELKVNHVWTSGTPDELNALVEGYLNSGWKMFETKAIQIDRYNRIVEMIYVFVKNENAYSQDEAIVQVGNKQHKSKVETETVPA